MALIGRIGADLRDAGTIALRAPQVARYLFLVRDLLLGGGRKFQVPNGANDPDLTVLLQLDGDVIVRVNPEVFKRPRAELADLLRRYVAALEAHVPLTDPVVVAALPGALRTARSSHWLVAVALQPWGFHTLTLAWDAVQPFAVLELWLVAGPFVIRHATPFVFRAAIRWFAPTHARPPKPKRA